MQEKPFWASKQLWINSVALVASLSLGLGVDLGLNLESQAALVGGIMSVVNIALRFVTRTAIKV